MKGIYQFAANLLSYIHAKYYWNRSTSDLVIAKSKRVNLFLKHSVYYIILTYFITFQSLQVLCCIRLLDFYRATRMHSADYAVVRCLSVCLSVCPSVRHTPVLCLNGYTYPQIFFTIGSPTILVFPHHTAWQYSDGNPPNGGVECKGYEKNHDFRPIYGFISQIMQDRAIVTMEGE